MAQVILSSDFSKQLGCENNPFGGITTDFLGRTNNPGIYAAGDA